MDLVFKQGQGMNREDIIRMAREAGMDYLQYISPEAFEKVVAHSKLIAQHEREACANTAGLALLGADKALSDRVLKAIRARGQA